MRATLFRLFNSDLSGTTLNLLSHWPLHHDPTAAGGTHRPPGAWPTQLLSHGGSVTAKLERRRPHLFPPPPPAPFCGLNHSCLPETPLSDARQQPQGSLGPKPTVKPWAPGLPAKVTEHGQAPLPPRGMLGRDAPKSEVLSARQAPSPHSAPYSCGGPERPPPPACGRPELCAALPLLIPDRSRHLPAPLSRSRALPGPESSYRWRSPRSAAGSASPRCFARSAPHSYFLRKERSKSPVQGTMPGRARRESVHSASLREQLVLEAPAGSDSGRLRHLRACGPLPPGDWDSRAALGHCSVGARGVGGETHCPGAYWCLRREGTGGRVAQLAPRAGSRQRGRQPRLSHAGKRSTGAAGSRAGGGGGWRGKRVPRGGAGARGRCEARVVGQSRAAAIMLRRLTGEQIRDWFTIGKAVTAVEFLGEEAQPGALRGPPYRPPSPPAAREPLTAAGWVRVLWSWSARRCSSRPGCRAVCEGAGWPACSRGCDRGPGCAGRFARVWVTHSGSAALPGLGGVWLLDSSLTPSSVVFVAVVQVWVGAGLWV